MTKPEPYADSDRPPMMIGTQNATVVVYWENRAHKAEAELNRLYGQFRYALSRADLNDGQA